MNITALFIHLLKCAVHQTTVEWQLFEGLAAKDWEQLYLQAKRQGVVAVLFEKVKDIPKSIAPPRQLFFKWLAHSLSIEKQMTEKSEAAIDFAQKLAERDIETAVLKGLAFAHYYPNPLHRESGDLDCYLMGKKAEGDKVVVEIGGKMKEAGYKHSHLLYRGLTIENHQFITSFDNSKLGIRTEQLLQSLIKEGYTPIGDTKLLNPCAEFNALFLIKHAQRHFIKEGIRIRYLLDWALFLKAESANIDWQRVIQMMDECRILNFAKILTQLCIDKLGMEINIEQLKGSCAISEAVFADIMGEQPDLFHENFIEKIGRIIRRFYRMWRFRSLADESYLRLIWNTLAFNSYTKKRANYI